MQIVKIITCQVVMAYTSIEIYMGEARIEHKFLKRVTRLGTINRKKGLQVKMLNIFALCVSGVGALLE